MSDHAMPETLRQLVPLLSFLASSAGAGVVASWLFDSLRRRFPCPAKNERRRVVRAWYVLLYAPAYARISAIALAWLIALFGQIGLELMAGKPIGPVVDYALASCVAALVGQVQHGFQGCEKRTVPSLQRQVQLRMVQRHGATDEVHAGGGEENM